MNYGKLDEVEAEILKIEKQLKRLPDEKLIITSHNGYSKWYINTAGKEKYLSKKYRELAQKLALKRYLLARLDDLQFQKKVISANIKRLNRIHHNSENLMAANSPYRALVLEAMNVPNSSNSLWCAEKWISNPNYPEHLIHKTLNGNFVRSKSEVIIANELFNLAIPYRYECELQLGEHLLYPDFTILHPNTGKIIYWEHFGMMDDANYVSTFCNKIKYYAANDIIIGSDLICTYETLSKPLDVTLVKDIINHYFLS